MPTESLFLRRYLDEDFHPDLASILREHGVDCSNAVESRMLERSDHDQLAYASQGRCLVSFNAGDFSLLARQWAKESRSHAGIIVTPQVGRRKLGELLIRILRLVNSVTADEM
jgi:hypothetical protein